ncbi:MAG: BON domain-containing protein [Ferruginibacter sp.]
MKLTKVLLVAVIAAAVGFTGCKPNDAEVKTSIEKAIQANPDMGGLTVDVKDGVATLSGTCKDDACRTKCADAVKGMKGVKEVVNNISLPAPPPPPTPAAPVVNSADEVLAKGINDVLKDIPGITTAVKDGVVTLTGEITKAKWMVLKQTIDKMKPTGYDLKGLKIK